MQTEQRLHCRVLGGSVTVTLRRHLDDFITRVIEPWHEPRLHLVRRPRKVPGGAVAYGYSQWQSQQVERGEYT